MTPLQILTVASRDSSPPNDAEDISRAICRMDDSADVMIVLSDEDWISLDASQRAFLVASSLVYKSVMIDPIKGPAFMELLAL
jgi:hypothetical protein